MMQSKEYLEFFIDRMKTDTKYPNHGCFMYRLSESSVEPTERNTEGVTFHWYWMIYVKDLCCRLPLPSVTGVSSRTRFS